MLIPTRIASTMPPDCEPIPIHTAPAMIAETAIPTYVIPTWGPSFTNCPGSTTSADSWGACWAGGRYRRWRRCKPAYLLTSPIAATVLFPAPATIVRTTSAATCICRSPRQRFWNSELVLQRHRWRDRHRRQSVFPACRLRRFGSLRRRPLWKLRPQRFPRTGDSQHRFSLNETIHITERYSLTLRGEAFNIFNHTQFFNPDGNIHDDTFGQVTTAHDPRLVQLTLKFQF